MKYCNRFPVEKMCKVLNVSTSGYYYWLNCPISKRKVRRTLLLEQINQAFYKSKRTYGSPRITKELNMKGIAVSQKTVAEIMKQNALRSVFKRKFKTTTDSNHNYPVSPNLLKQNFTVERYNQVWVSDITYIKTRQGWLYLTVILDLYDRKVIGWSMSGTMNANDTIIRAWNMAVKNRPILSPLIFHSDRGIQYACERFRNKLKSYPLVSQSMSRKGNCWDNAVAESFFKSLKVEAIYPYKFKNNEITKLSVFKYIETWYNKNRRHSALGNLTIKEFEKFNNYKNVA